MAASTSSTSNSTHACGTGRSDDHASVPKQDRAAFRRGQSAKCLTPVRAAVYAEYKAAPVLTEFEPEGVRVEGTGGSAVGDDRAEAADEQDTQAHIHLRDQCQPGQAPVGLNDLDMASVRAPGSCRPPRASGSNALEQGRLDPSPKPRGKRSTGARGCGAVNMYVGLTDWDWYRSLSAGASQEVNFWRPSATQAFHALDAGELFLFKLHSPWRAIVGGGFFVAFTRLPVSLAWLAFGEDNGVPDRDTLLQAILAYRRRAGQETGRDPEIGNVVLAQPFFLPREAWIPEPAEWPAHTQRGKAYDTATPAGAYLWAQVADRLVGIERYREIAAHGAPAERVRAWALRRLGQGGFRVLVTDAYDRRCAVTGEHALPVLEAAHIRPVAQAGSHEVRNGILLRADLHILFDRGYVALDEDCRLVVSPRLAREYQNGREYYARTGQRILLPATPAQRPAPELLAWHRENVFVA